MPPPAPMQDLAQATRLIHEYLVTLPEHAEEDDDDDYEEHQDTAHSASRGHLLLGRLQQAFLTSTPPPQIPHHNTTAAVAAAWQFQHHENTGIKAEFVQKSVKGPGYLSQCS